MDDPLTVVYPQGFCIRVKIFLILRNVGERWVRYLNNDRLVAGEPGSGNNLVPL